MKTLSKLLFAIFIISFYVCSGVSLQANTGALCAKSNNGNVGFIYDYQKPVNADTLNALIDSLVARQIDENQPGGVIGIFHEGNILARNSYGIMDMDMDELSMNNETTRFNIASVSKQFTAFAILSLEKEGKLRLDDNIRDYLPGLPEYEYDITIRHLLQHTSGIASTDVLRLFAGLPLDEPWSQDDEFNLIKRYPQLNFKPNTSHVYSNAGYSLLALIVEKVSGMKFAVYLEENVFNPSNMDGAFLFDDPGIELVEVAKGYNKENEGFAMVSSDEDRSYGAGNIYAGLDDMLKWGENLLSDEAENQKYLNRISNPDHVLENGDTVFYNYGFNVSKHKGIRMVEHSGGVPGYRSQFMIFPDENLFIVLMFNNEAVNTRRIAIDIVETMLADKLTEEIPVPRVAIETDPALARSFAGNYQMPDGMELGFSYEQDTFWLVLPDDSKFQLFAESETKFFLEAFDAQCTFVRTGDEVNEMIWHQGGGDYKAVRVEEKTPLSDDDLILYAGDYLHSELKARYPVSYSDGTLTLHTPDTFKKYLGFDSVILSHISGDKFLTDRLGMMEFTRDDSGKINGFILADVGRLQNVRFSRM